MPDLVRLYYSEPDFEAITKAVSEAEQTSRAEIVVRLTSHCYGWVAERLTIGGLLALLGFFSSLYFTRLNDWGMIYNYQQAALWAIVGFMLGFGVDAVFLQTRSRYRRVVWKRARQVFGRLKRTSGNTAVLILLSLKERQAAIVVDQAVTANVASDYWDKPLGLIIDGMKSGDHAEGLIKAISIMGEELKAKLPSGSDDVDELPDRPEII